MLRYLQVNANKPIKVTYASEIMKQGMAVSADYANDEVDKATGIGEFLVDVPKSYNGIDAIIAPADNAFEDIAAADKVLRIPTYVGERYATSALTIGSLTVGAAIKAASGLFVAAVSQDLYGWVYGGLYDDPTGETMYIIERVATATV